MRMKPLVSMLTSMALVAVLPAAVAADEHDTTAGIRVLHAAGGAPAVDVYASGTQLGAPLEYGDISDYVLVDSGVYQVQVVPTGSLPATGSSVIDTELALAPGTMTTVVATGSLDAGIVPVVLHDEPDPGDGIAQVRISHFVFYAPPVDVALDSGDVIVPGLAFADSVGYLDLPEGEYDFELRLAGTSDVIIDADPVILDDQTSISVFAIGDVADGSFSIVSAVDASPDLRTRIEEGVEDVEEGIDDLEDQIEEGLEELEEEIDELIEEDE